MKKNAGFTLIELVVTIAIAAVMMTAVSTVILLGMNNNRVINQTITTQNDSRVITELLQTLTSRGTITGVVKLGNNYVIQGAGEGDDAEPVPLLTYSAADRALKSSDGRTFMENVQSFDAYLGDKNDVSVDEDGMKHSSLLTLVIEADGKTYERSIYCRTQEFVGKTTSITLSNEGDIPVEIESETITSVDKTEPLPNVNLNDLSWDETKTQRIEFLKLLATQYGSTGKIQYGDGTDTGVSFAAWYSNGAWSDDTPWCACFVSWAAYFAGQVDLIGEVPEFASVPVGIDYFKSSTSAGTWKESNPDPGDYIFFNFNQSDSVPDHVGVVLFTYTENGENRVATIEGNTSGYVGMRSYPLSSTSIVGYGVLDWKTP